MVPRASNRFSTARTVRWCAALWLFASVAVADVAPRPYQASYAATLNGMPLGFDVHLTLAGAGQDTWELAVAAGSNMLHYRESSRFRWQACQATPLAYRYEFRGFGIDRKLWLDFDHARRVASGESRRGAVSYAFPADATDEVSLSYAARCQLVGGQSQVGFNVATTTGMKRFDYRIDGRETIRTPYGRLDTLRIVRVRDKGDKRRSVLWVAPALDHIMVKMEHVEKLGVRGGISLKTLTGITPATVAPAIR